MSKYNIYFFGIVLVILGCTENDVPKDKGYPRYSLPERAYQFYQSDCPYQFEYPKYASIEDKKSFFCKGDENGFLLDQYQFQFTECDTAY